VKKVSIPPTDDVSKNKLPILRQISVDLIAVQNW